MSIDEIFAGPSQHNLPGNTDLCIFLESDGRLLLIAVVEDDRYAGFCYSCLSALVDEILDRYVNFAPLFAEKDSYTWRFCARTVVIFVIPRTKHIESKIFDFPLPFSPVIELKLSSLHDLSALITTWWVVLFTILKSPFAQRTI